MLAPFYKYGMFDQMGMVIAAICAGLIFGYLIVSTGMSNPRKIAAVFYGSDWSVMKVMFTAVVTCIIFTFASFYVGILDVSLVQLTSFNYSGQIVGGLIFGIGMSIAGYCPGTAIAASATRNVDAYVFIFGFLAGIWIFAGNYSWISTSLYSENLGKLTLSDVFHVSYGTMAMLVVLVALGTFYLLDKTEGKLYKSAT